MSSFSVSSTRLNCKRPDDEVWPRNAHSLADVCMHASCVRACLFVYMRVPARPCVGRDAAISLNANTASVMRTTCPQTSSLPASRPALVWRWSKMRISPVRTQMTARVASWATKTTPTSTSIRTTRNAPLFVFSTPPAPRRPAKPRLCSFQRDTFFATATPSTFLTR